MVTDSRQAGGSPTGLVAEIEYQLHQYYCEGGDPADRTRRILALFAQHGHEESREALAHIR